MTAAEQLASMLRTGASQEEAFAFFDSLDSPGLGQMTGLWKGEELRTGHPFEGLLSAAGWYGKRFDDSENVHPLVFETPQGTLYYGNPGIFPLTLPVQIVPRKLVSLVMNAARPLISTDKSRARLRVTEFRGKPSVSMVYDQKAIIDVFRLIDENTVLGVMDIKELKSPLSFFFVLRKIR